mmetsp:Transcript_125048/g.286522  ORF Transcript_125048/g.286522 Transcript_125048/m.286522 type:complete len:214 (-) Transcript_125048:1143-1784(-)
MSSSCPWWSRDPRGVGRPLRGVAAPWTRAGSQGCSPSADLGLGAPLAKWARGAGPDRRWRGRASTPGLGDTTAVYRADCRVSGCQLDTSPPAAYRAAPRDLGDCLAAMDEPCGPKPKPIPSSTAPAWSPATPDRRDTSRAKGSSSRSALSGPGVRGLLPPGVLSAVPGVLGLEYRGLPCASKRGPGAAEASSQVPNTSRWMPDLDSAEAASVR